MWILGVIVVLVCAVIVWNFVLKSQSKKKNSQIEEMENAYKDKDKLPLLSFGNIYLSDEPKKTLELINTEGMTKKLKDSFDVTDRESALKIIQWLLEEGQRKTGQPNYIELLETIEAGREHELKHNYDIVSGKLKSRLNVTDADLKNCKNIGAFDFERLGIVLRASRNAGYISDQECYQYLGELYTLTASVYKRWIDYAIAFFIGYAVCTNSNESTFFMFDAEKINQCA